MKILVTGRSGYLGSAVVPALRARGHEVVTIGRRPGVDAACDLTDAGATRDAVRAVGEVDAVVHLAARAHDFRGLAIDDLVLANVSTTRNLVAALRAEGAVTSVRFVHASSVAVYELLDTNRRVTAAEAPYGASKLAAEQLLSAEPFRSLCVLRFAPIYDPAHLQDVAKRVFLPGTRVKMRLFPPPMHSLCSLDRAVQSLVDAVEKTPSRGSFVVNATDPQPISQRELVGWFPGLAVPVPTAVLRAFARGLSLCGQPGRAASRLTSKFTTDTTYPQAIAVHATSEVQGDRGFKKSASP